MAINGWRHKTAVSVATTETDLLTAAEQSTTNMQIVGILPATDIYIGGVGVTTANSPWLCPGGVLTTIKHTSGPLKGICASGTVSTKVSIGVG